MCIDCDLPVKVPGDSKSAMLTIKEGLLNSGDLNAFSDDQYYREQSINNVHHVILFKI